MRVEVVVVRDSSASQSGPGQVIPQAPPVGRRGLALGGPCLAVLRPLHGCLFDGRVERERQVGGEHVVERRRVHGPRRSHPAPERQPRHAQVGRLEEQADARARELQLQLQRIRLDRGARGDPRPGHGELLFGALHPLPSHARQLGPGEHGVIVRLGEHRRGEPRLELTGMRAIERGSRAADLGDLLSPREQVVLQDQLGRHRVGFGLERPEVEERRQALGRVGPDVHRRQKKHRERGAPRPLGVVHLSQGSHVIGVEPRGPAQRLGQRHDRQRVNGRRGYGRSLQLEL